MQTQDHVDLLQALKTRFDASMARHPGLAWRLVQARLEDKPSALRTLHAMQASGGEPDVIKHDLDAGAIMFCDCAAESPPGRRSLCYDSAALDARKDNKPHASAVAQAAAMGAQLLTEAEYHALQALGEFDIKTSSWIATPPDVRAQGGALFGDRRYGRVFVYHNGAQSYYAARGFRVALWV